MTLRVRWLRCAERSLEHIADTIAQDNPKAAYDTIMLIRSAANRLAEAPHIGRKGRVEGTYELVVTANYLLPYRICGNEVQILHVFHAARRWPDVF